MTDNTDDEIRKSFEDFMLMGKRKKKNENKSNYGNVTPNKIVWSKIEESDEHARSSPDRRYSSPAKVDKRYWQLFKKFCTAVTNDWINIDDQLGEVLHSISNIRARLPLESRLVDELLRRENLFRCSAPRNMANFKGVNASTVTGYLTLDDINLTFSHDLLQHEKMISAVRKLMSALSEAQEYLGRQLDEALNFHIDYSTDLSEDESLRSEKNAMILIDDMNDVYTMLSRELYRKQNLVTLVFDTVSYVLQSGSKHIIVEDSHGMNHVDLFERVVREWPRGSEESFIEIEHFDYIMRKCDP
eukprot:CAMPEP_0172487634 /NCGR_PEP_ID=MMETSP1066-20121228/16774_1 /TAXON_ID=671091 /ORGANISM="Coscinodiscus wailesii, Strain CCMP2513" /LENGTH=300 /DNA_ID=CAMNT_0013254359 /DNA_START=416 /DNA_END=1318 /DNA_ORIENTATION=-